MASTLDPAIIEALSLDLGAKITPHGCSGFSSTYKITTTSNGKEKLYFVKTSTGDEAKVMFEGEHTSLNAIHSILPSICPPSFAHGPLRNATNTHFLATSFLQFSSASTRSSKSLTQSPSLATKLAMLHYTAAPIPPGFLVPQFGFPVPTCCGPTPQSNTYSPSWSLYFANQRLRTIQKACQARNGLDSELEALIEWTAAVVVPRLLKEGHLRSSDGGDIVPVVVHGDLWSGNRGWTVVADDDVETEGKVEEVVFDPSSCYAHNEYELGIMKLFGGFGEAFFTEYHESKGKDEPVEEYPDRIELYALYHQLNHHAIFGGAYRSGAVSMMKKLINNFGQE